MPPTDSVSLPASGLDSSHNVQMNKDHVLNMSPRPSCLRNHNSSLDKTPSTRGLDKKQSFNSSSSVVSNVKTVSKSSAELVKEIATLEVEIVHLERYLLSLYRTAFQQHLPRISSNHAEQVSGRSHGTIITSEQPSPKLKMQTAEECKARLSQSSPTSSLTGPKDSVRDSIPKSSSGSGKQSFYSEHRSLADHLGSSCMDDARICPDRLSEDIIRCVSSIYCKLANPALAYKGCSVSSTSSFCSSSTFSPRNFSGSWSPPGNDEVTENCDFEGPKQGNGPYTAMVEVLRIGIDDESYSYAANMLQKFRSLVKSLEIVDPMKMRREEKLAFWINIHNALVMHAYLAYGTQNYIKSAYILKASYNVGGHCINAYDIQSSILGIRSHYSAPWLQTLLYPGKKFKTGNTKHPYAIEYSEPLVHFALCSGAYSDPAVRVYTANNVFHDLNVAKEEFIQATVYVHKESKIYLPKILCYYAKDMSMGMAALLEVVSGCVTSIQQKAIKTCVKGRPEKYVYWLEQSSSFRYLIHKEIAETRWGA
ncbi:Protein of unknown function- DUF547 [Striga hermonthica]|uniref:DUF547 domain-containing protein n=1 Tax=Striga hermonthica TaxID=68872 RepID=A0A9N7MII6_STRHE|nr:Protein of unknown function- DUF547 [Striga hermonthica]